MGFMADLRSGNVWVRTLYFKFINFFEIFITRKIKLKTIEKLLKHVFSYLEESYILDIN